MINSQWYCQAAVYGRDPNWGRIACAAGYAGISFDLNKLRIMLGDILLMDGGQPLPFDRWSLSPLFFFQKSEPCKLFRLHTTAPPPIFLLIIKIFDMCDRCLTSFSVWKPSISCTLDFWSTLWKEFFPIHHHLIGFWKFYEI